MKYLLLAFSLLLLASCGIVSGSNPLPENFGYDSVEIYMGRSGLSEKNFEQFKVTKSRIFAECGRIAGGRQVSQYQAVNRISGEDLQDITGKVWKIIDFTNNHELKLDPPDKGTGYFDRGQFTVSIRAPGTPRDIKTTLDSMASPSKTSEKNLNELAKTVRAIAVKNSGGASLCGKDKFYDLG